MLIVEIPFNTVIKHHLSKPVLCVFMNVSPCVWLTSGQPEHILAELECEIQRGLFCVI